MRSLRLLPLLALLALAGVATAHAEGPESAWTSADVVQAISDASAATGVSAGLLWSVVRCEDPALDPYVVGDGGTSYGPAQLHAGGSELPRFYAEGNDDPYSPYQAIGFMASEIAIDRGRAWSCFP